MEKPPDFEQGDIRAIASGKLNFEEGPYTTKIDVKVDECTYLTSHNSGHFTKFVWKKDVGSVRIHGRGNLRAKLRAEPIADVLRRIYERAS